MKSSIYEISLIHLLWILIPLFVVMIIFKAWKIPITTPIYGMVRMFLQLIAIGYALNFIFTSSSPWIIMGILLVMLAAASVIAARPLQVKPPQIYLKTFAAIATGGVPTLIIVVFGVVQLSPWYDPRYLIPLAGMIFANSMNAVSIAAERFASENHRKDREESPGSVAFRAAMIPITNSLFAVGIVSLPGMMTGQILSGVSPLIAVRYQIMVMCMIFGAAGISSAVYLFLNRE